MPSVNEMFPSRYLKAADFDETGTPLTIKKVTEETIGQGKDADNKWVVHFKEKEKGLVLNKTNTTTISKLYGDDTDGWIGKMITLYYAEVEFKGEMTPAIRVKTRAPKPKAAKAAVAPEADNDDEDDDIPF